MATVERLRVGVLGLGAFGERHLSAYRGLPQVEVTAVASRSAARAREVAERYAVPRWYGDYAGLIADPAVDAISVTTAEGEHRAPTVAALGAGKHVLVEKPFATTLDDAAAMLAAGRRSPAMLMPGHILRFEPKYAALKSAIAAGDLGDLVSMAARRNRSRDHVASHGRVHLGLVTAIHDLDVMLWLAGDRVTSVRAHHRLAERPGQPHGLWALLRFARGTIATLETSWMLPAPAGLGGDDAFEVVGTAGTAKIQFDVPGLRIWTETRATAPDVSYEPMLHGAVTGALRDELASFVASARSGTPSTVVTPEDGLAAVAVALAAIESAEREAEVAVVWPAALA